MSYKPSFIEPRQVLGPLQRMELIIEKDVELQPNQTVKLENDKIVENGYPKDSDTDTFTTIQIMDQDTGDIVSEQDYSVNKKPGFLTYTGSETVTAELKYFTSSVASEDVNEIIMDASERVENHTDTFFDRPVKVSDEFYRGTNRKDTVILFEQPVIDVLKVEVKKNGVFEEVDSENYYIKNNVAVRFHKAEDQPNEDERAIRITYIAGFDNVPREIQNLTKIITAEQLFKTNVFGAGIAGRDNFDPDTVFNFEKDRDESFGEWSRKFYSSIDVTERGESERVESW